MFIVMGVRRAFRTSLLFCILGGINAACYNSAEFARTLPEKSARLSAAQSALELQPSALNHVALGLALTSLGHHEEAVQHYEQALTIDPQYSDANKHLCMEYGILEQWDKAIGSCEKALSVHPDDSSSRNCLRYANRGKASEVFAQAPALINLGLKHYNEGNWSEAVKVWSQIPPQSPQFATARSNLASALIKTKDFAGARAMINEALRIDPKNELFQNNARWLETEAAKAH